jgi:hypothetical protein
MNRQNKMQLAIPFLGMLALFWLSSIPGKPFPGDPELYGLILWVSPSVQNALHVPVYAMLAWSWHWALGAWQNASRARIFLACTIASVYGVLDEWHQSFVPGRFASLTDAVFNVAGAVLGVWLAVRLTRATAPASGR